jgi:rhodanese-related sulfurtransferase
MPAEPEPRLHPEWRHVWPVPGLRIREKSTRTIRIRKEVLMSKFENVPADDWEDWSTANDAVILDVRQPDEWALGTLPGSKLISMGELVDRLSELEKARPVLCVCRSGARSAQVAAYLSTAGFATVANMAGGVKALGMQD